jgi:hypothetical protein
MAVSHAIPLSFCPPLSCHPIILSVFLRAEITTKYKKRTNGSFAFIPVHSRLTPSFPPARAVMPPFPISGEIGYGRRLTFTLTASKLILSVGWAVPTI